MAKNEDKLSLRQRAELQGLPTLVVVNNLRKFCHERVDDQTEDGDVYSVKMRATEPFLDKFNEIVYDLLVASIQTARQEDRTTMKPEDIPNILEA